MVDWPKIAKIVLISGSSVGLLVFIELIRKDKRILNLIKNSKILNIKELEAHCKEIDNAELNKVGMKPEEFEEKLKTFKQKLGNFDLEVLHNDKAFEFKHNKNEFKLNYKLPENKEIIYEGIVCGKLGTNKPVLSRLNMKLLKEMWSIRNDRKNNKLVGHSNTNHNESESQKYSLGWMEKILLGKNKNKASEKSLQILQNMSKEHHEEKNVAIIQERIFELHSNNNVTKHSACSVNSLDMRLYEGDFQADLNILLKNNPLDIIKLGTKENHRKLPEANIMKIIGSIIGMIGYFFGNTSFSSKFFWKFATEENEYKIKVGTPIVLFGRFRYKNGKMIAEKVSFFGNSLYQSIERIKQARYMRQIIALCFAGVLTYFAAKEFLSYKKKFQSKKILKEQKKMEKTLAAWSETIDENYRCVICYNYIRNIIFKPCMHLICCKLCIDSMKENSHNLAGKCPICKEFVTEYVEIRYKS